MIPEITFLSFIKTIVSALRNNNNLIELLYSNVEENIFEDIDFLSLAKEMFSRKPSDPKYIDIDITYATTAEKGTSIFMTLDGENFATNTIGGIYEQDQAHKNVYARRFNNSYSLYIYSDNFVEALIIYHTIKLCLIGVLDFAALKGFQNMKISGQDVSQHPDYIPKTFFYKVLTISFETEVKVPYIFYSTLINSITYIPDPVQS